MKAVIYGAGNIGRGFIGQLLSGSGYEVVFIDVDDRVVGEINRQGRYPVTVVSNEGKSEEWVENVRAVDGKNAEAAAAEIADADIVATAVGANILPKIAPVISRGLGLRFEAGARPVNIIICENLLNAGAYLKSLVKDSLPEGMHGGLEKNVGFVEASIGRMVPVMTDEMRGDNFLRIWVEPYNSLPVDKEAFVGDMPKILNLKPFSPFEFYVKRKLFIHNLGHAACAYLGHKKGYKYIWQAVGDDDIKSVAESAMRESAAALAKHYALDMGELEAHIKDLLGRFANRALGDSVARVGRDPMRKLSKNDRLAGAALFCKGETLPYDAILKVIAAGLDFFDGSDPSSVKMRDMIKDDGKEQFLVSWCGFGLDDAKKVMEN